jgi:hypothetical protein
LTPGVPKPRACWAEAALAELELAPPHKSNRKITLPWPTDSLYPVPNIQNHGTRNLGIILSGGAEMRDNPEGGLGKIAVLADRTIGRVDFTREPERALLDLVSPRTIKTMVATARLIWEKTNHQAIPNQAATLSTARSHGRWATRQVRTVPSTQLSRSALRPMCFS